MWIRDWMDDVSFVVTPNAGAYDLLWKVRTGASIQDGGAMNYDTGEVLVAPLAAESSNLPKSSVQGSTIKRIRLKGIGVMPVANADPEDGFVIGLRTQRMSSTGYGVTTAGTPANLEASVAEDWLYWERFYLGGPSTAIIGDVGSETYSTEFCVDTRCSRKLEDWGDSLFFYLSPMSVNVEVHLTWSVLLHLA